MNLISAGFVSDFQFVVNFSLKLVQILFHLLIELFDSYSNLVLSRQIQFILNLSIYLITLSSLHVIQHLEQAVQKKKKL